MFLSLLLAIACNNDLPKRPGADVPATTSPASAENETVPDDESDPQIARVEGNPTIENTAGGDPIPNPNATAPAAAKSEPATPAAVVSTKAPRGVDAVAINSDGSLRCDALDPELRNLHQFRGWIGTPATEAGTEIFIAEPVFPGKAQNGQGGKCVDSAGNVLFADHVRFTTSTSFVRPSAPPTDSPWFDKNRWGKEAEGKATELVATAGDLRVMCFDGTGARCVPAKYEPKKPKSEGKQIVITVPEGTEVKVGSATGS